MEIVIIDDGVNDEYLNFKLKHDLKVSYDLEVRKRNLTKERHFSHGTICAAIISKYAPEATITSIKVLDDKIGTGSKNQLLAALKWCLDKQVKLINLSIGTIQYQDFKEICFWISQLYRNGCIVVAAYNNKNIYTMPASIECTIGVRHNGSIEDYVIREGEYEDYIEAKGKHEVVIHNKKKYISRPFNSFATPYITALVHNIIKDSETDNLAEIWGELSGDNKNNFCHFPNFIDSAIIIDISQDEYTELFYFQVQALYYINDLDKIENIRGRVYLVILANDTDSIDLIIEKIESIEKNVRGVFCGFNYENIIDAQKYHIFNRIWHEQYYWDKYEHIDECKSIDVPLIYIYGNGRQLVKILLGIEHKFVLEGYALQIIGEFNRAYLYGFEYANSKNRKKVIQNVYKRFNSDLIICGIDCRNVKHDDADLVFILNKDKIEVVENGTNIAIGNITESDGVKDIYKKIVERFS